MMETKKPIIDREEHSIAPDGSELYLSATKAPIFDRKGNVMGIVGITRDITEQKRAEKTPGLMAAATISAALLLISS